MNQIVAFIIGLALIAAVSHAKASTEVMLCQQQELKINKKSITSKKMDGGKQVWLVNGSVSTPVDATKALLTAGETKSN